MKRSLIVILVIGLGLGFVYLVQDRDPATLATLPADLMDAPNVVIEDAQISRFATNGRLNVEIRATVLNQFSDRSVATLQDVDVSVTDHRNAVHRIRANRATLHEAEETADERLVLGGSVLLSRESDALKETLETETLVLFPGRRYVESDVPVTMTRGISKIRAGSFKRDFNTGWTKLERSLDGPVEAEIATRTVL